MKAVEACPSQRNRVAGKGQCRPEKQDVVISYIVYARAVSILGLSSGAAFAASCPVMTALMAIPILGEWPPFIDWLAIVLISVAVCMWSAGADAASPGMIADTRFVRFGPLEIFTSSALWCLTAFASP